MLKKLLGFWQEKDKDVVRGIRFEVRGKRQVKGKRIKVKGKKNLK